MSDFLKDRWFSQRLNTHITMARWGHFGQPVLVFPTAGGDAEEIERFLMIRALGPLLEAGRIKVYSIDSVAGQVFFDEGYPAEQRMRIQNRFHEYIRHEVVPAIHKDCGDSGLGIWTAGASIGAFHAVAAVCRFPDVVHRALGMSGSYDILRFIQRPPVTQDFYFASPLHFVPGLEGPQLDLLRQRRIHLATGAGRAENVGESWNMAKVLGSKGVPNWVDDWGPDWHHDWPTWRNMLPKYLDEWTATG